MQETLQDMVKMIDDLPVEYCEALCLTELGGMSQKEYAEEAGISYSGAKARVQRAKKKLKDNLMKCCHYQFDRYGTVVDIHPVNCWGDGFEEPIMNFWIVRKFSDNFLASFEIITIGNYLT